MIQHTVNTKHSKFRRFDRFSKFVLIGNNIDGRVNVWTEEFQNFEEVKQSLPKIFQELDFEGEWTLKLYQVPDNYTIHHRYGYYKVPSRGKLVLEYSYMVAGDEIEIFITNKMIHIASISKSIDRYWKPIEEEKECLQIYEEYVTVELIENLDGREIKNAEYRGNIDELFAVEFFSKT